MREVSPNFITDVIDQDLASGKHDHVVTRFPPEPNGYLHIGHAKAIILNFGVGTDYRGKTYLRMDDTNPTTEDQEYVRAIQEDVEWLGFDPAALTYASDQFEEFYRHAVSLIERGLAYVDSQSEEDLRLNRGTVNEPGRPGPYRDRSVEENLDLFRRMRAGEFPAGSHVLRARIGLDSPNMLMRDPILYRIRHAEHYRTGDEWPIYPMYDYAHPLTDALEGVTHSLCTLEFDNNREVYDWVVENTVNGPQRPHQYEFSRLQLDYTITSKRKLMQLVQGGIVSGWDDPRMPTIAGLRRRGVTPEALKLFVNRVGVTKTNARTDLALLENSIREDLNDRAPRVMAVIEPLQVKVTNYDGTGLRTLQAPYWPPDVARDGERGVPFGPQLLIERADFSEEPPKGYRRLSPGKSVRLRHGPVIRCDRVLKDEDGNVTGLECSLVDEDTRVEGAIHWLESTSALPAEFRLYDRLFTVPDPEATDRHFTELINPQSLVMKHGFVEPAVAGFEPSSRFQFERQGYFWRDPLAEESLVFNRIVTLKDSWSRPAATPRPAPAREKAASAPEPEREFTDVEKAFASRHGIPEADAAVILSIDGLDDWYGQAAAPGLEAPVARWVVNELVRTLKDTPLAELKLTPAGLTGLVRLVEAGSVSSLTAKEVLERSLASGQDPASIIESENLAQVSDRSELEASVAQVLTDNPDQVAAWRGGKHGLSGYFVGQVMKATGGKANPQMVKEIVEEALRGHL